MLEGVLAILVCQLLGTLAVSLLHLPVPGPIIGMLLLLAVLLLRRPQANHPALRAGDRLLDVLPLLFVPAGVGVIAAFGPIRTYALSVGVGLVAPWVLSLLAAAGGALAVRRFATADDDESLAAAPDGSAPGSENSRPPRSGEAR